MILLTLDQTSGETLDKSMEKSTSDQLYGETLDQI
jgi:hypothetical protein